MKTPQNQIQNGYNNRDMSIQNFIFNTMASHHFGFSPTESSTIRSADTKTIPYASLR